ncbi:DNA binding protein [Mycobacterium phage CRB1]|uniref:DNA binding protein n=1 Tax=Mycobacterium phage CRB1 TaxID=1458841 RepID=UPI0003F20599|nr:DNA binding protein [Mycobacterium phage CRB1]AHJ86645.1 putative Rep protein [Mycobacterium phage CRB1]
MRRGKISASEQPHNDKTPAWQGEGCLSRRNATVDVSFHGSARIRQAEAATRNRDAFRNWLERQGASAAPRWLSREQWLRDVTEWSMSDRFTECGISMSPATFMAIMRVMSDYADHSDGRCVAVSRERIASTVGCAPGTVTRAWRLLRLSGYGLEIQRGHGSDRTPSQGCRPSIYHLVSKRRPVVGNVHLPPKAAVVLSSPVGSSSPRAAARPKRWHRREEPHPIELQRLAARLRPMFPAYSYWNLCNALAVSGIDPGEWTADRIYTAVNSRPWRHDARNPQGYLVQTFRRVSSR